MNHPWFRSWSRAQLVLILGALVLGAALRLIENDVSVHAVCSGNPWVRKRLACIGAGRMLAHPIPPPSGGRTGGGPERLQNDRPFASSDHAQLAAILTFFQKYDEQFGSWRSMFLIGTRQ